MGDYDTRITALPPAIHRLLSQIDEQKGQWIGGANLSPQILTRLRRSVLVTSTGASTRIEGSSLSDEAIEKLMHGLTTQKFADRDSQEVRGYYEVLRLIFESAPDMRFSESLLLHLHAQLLQYADQDQRHRGQYKHLENKVEMKDHSGQVLAVLFETTPAYLTPKAMQELVNWTVEAQGSQRHHPLLIIANFVVSFLQIHPFLDGNGRMSRLLTNLLMLQVGYDYMPYISHEKLIEASKSEYYVALRRSQKTFGTTDTTIEAWTGYFLEILLEQAKQAAALLSSDNVIKLLSPNQLKVWTYLSDVGEATPGQIAEVAGVARPTVSQALNRLMQLQKVERRGAGRTTSYRKL